MAPIAKALEAGEPIARLLVRADVDEPPLRSLVEAARANAVPVSEEPAREMQRMTAGDGIEPAIALVGPPLATTTSGLLKAPGLALHLCGLRYPGNVGFILRAAEVAGAAGVLLDVDWSEKQHGAARRKSIHADRFLPVLQAETGAAFEAARKSGRRIVAVETSGRETPWTLDLATPSLVVVGGESEGIPDDLLAQADATVRIPTRGFIPSYNVQAAVGMLLGEWLRQTEPLD